MKAKRIIAAAAALCLTSTSFIPAAYCIVPVSVPAITASAAQPPYDGDTVYEGDMTFRVFEDHAELDRYSRLAEGDAVIPSEINGVPVTVIRRNAFTECDKLSSVTIPDTITVIREDAFAGSGMTKIVFPENFTDFSVESLRDSAWLEARREESPFVVVNGVLVDAATCKGDAVIPDTVKYIGDMAFSECSDMTSVTIPESVTEIRDLAFTGCSGLEEIVVPDSVASIGSMAFMGCENVRKVTLPAGLKSITKYMLDGCIKLESVILPETLTEIGASSFYHCDALTEISIPASVTTIGDNAFEFSGLKSFTLPGTVDYVGAGILANCESLEEITLPDGLIKISADMLRNCPKLEKVVIPDSVEEIDISAFDYCTGLKEITIPAGVKKIGEYAFAGCPLVSVELPDSVEEIGESAFSECEMLKTLRLSEKLSSIPKNLCFSCKSLEEITIPAGVTMIGSGAFDSCRKLTSVVIPEGTVVLDDGVFRDCASLTDITIPSSVQSIGGETFWNTPWLKEQRKQNPFVIVNGILIDGLKCSGDVVIPEEVTAVARYAFSDCDNMTSVVIPASVKKIGDRPFYGCDQLAWAALPVDFVIDGHMFSNCQVLTDIYYAGTRDQWEQLGESSIIGDLDHPMPDIHYGTSGPGTGAAVTPEEVVVEGMTFDLYDNYAVLRKASADITGKVVIPSKVKGLPVNTIADLAFQDCDKMTEVNIPDSVVWIGDYAFNNCSGLEDITSITIPGSVIHFGFDAFAGTKWLELRRKADPLVIVNSILIDGRACKNGAKIPHGITAIGQGAFYGCKDLTTVTLSDTVIEIGKEAFSGCEKLESVGFSEGLITIGDYAFDGCTELLEIRIPEGVSEIGIRAFKDTGLTKVTIPGTASIFGDEIFLGCSRLQYVTLEQGIEEIPELMFEYCTNLKEVTIPDSVKKIGTGAFGFCKYITEIKLPDSVEEIGNAAFVECRRLESFTIPEGVKNIGDRLFTGCSGLKEIYIPASVKKVGKDAFDRCDQLTYVCYYGTPMTWNELEKNSETEGNEALFKKASVYFKTAGTEIPAGKYGDANGDGKITVADAVAVLQYIANKDKYPISEESLLYADCDGEAGITGGDAIMIQKYDAGIIDKFPAEEV
ncbi:MAG: leucine-rich repeat protein [Ruminococcus sp.]|nr:leucine-rich repeat protein [Ruminococcus sp.]